MTAAIRVEGVSKRFRLYQERNTSLKATVLRRQRAVFKELWTREAPKFDGKYTRFDNLVFAHKPAKAPPIWVGGESGPALRRTAKLGDAWYPIGTNPAFPLDSLKRLAAGIGKLRRLTAEAGRDPASMGVAYRIQRHGAGVPALAGDGERRLFSGSAGDVAGDLRDLAALRWGPTRTGDCPMLARLLDTTPYRIRNATMLF